MSIHSKPRFKLAALPTPLHEMPRLRQELGGDGSCPRLFIKRDDLTGLALGGNKARKLEFLIADALSKRATAVVTTGAVQSNHARMTAAAACAAGLKCSLVLSSGSASTQTQGNLLLDRLLGAEIHILPPHPNAMLATAEEESAKVAEVMEDLSQRGEIPYLIPVGGSSAIGSFGYVSGTLEIVRQLFELGVSPSRLYYANGSRGTQAGLVLGAKMYSAPYRVMGMAVSGGEPEKSARAMRIANEAAEMLGTPIRLNAADLENDESYIGPGYGLQTPECLEAIRLFARTEGILLDPVYTSKGAAGMIDHIRRGLIDPAETILFLHTGGAPALFAHATTLEPCY